MPRLNIERQNELEGERCLYAKEEIEKLGYEVTFSESGKELNFKYKGNTVKLFPYSGYFNGKGLVAGRGIQKLLNQIKQH